MELVNFEKLPLVLGKNMKAFLFVFYPLPFEGPKMIIHMRLVGLSRIISPLHFLHEFIHSFDHLTVGVVLILIPFHFVVGGFQTGDDCVEVGEAGLVDS